MPPDGSDSFSARLNGAAGEAWSSLQSDADTGRGDNAWIVAQYGLAHRFLLSRRRRLRQLMSD